MTVFDPNKLEFIRSMREAVLKEMELPSSADILVRLVRYMEYACEEVLAKKDHLSTEQQWHIRRAATDAPKEVEVLHDLIVDQQLSRDKIEDLLFSFAKLIDDALEIGFYLALDRKSLKRSERIIHGGSTGGQRGAQTRQAKAAADWLLIEVAAKAFRSAHPDWSQDNLASEVIATWKSETTPGHSKVKSIISKMEKAGTIAKRVSRRSVNEGGSAS